MLWRTVMGIPLVLVVAGMLAWKLLLTAEVLEARDAAPVAGEPVAIAGDLEAESPIEPEATVGRRDYGTQVTPVNQLIDPAGTQVELPGLRPQVVALSPDGSLLVTSGKTNEVVVVDPASGEILDRVKPPSEDLLDPPS